MAVAPFIPQISQSGILPDTRDIPSLPEISLESHAAPPAANVVITAPTVEPEVLMPFLHTAVELALRATGATGSAIAMRAGSGFRCYASVGDAPATNSPVRLAGTLTGLCVRKGKTVRCEDVARQAAAEVSGYAAAARSILLAPIYQEGVVAGVIGIFAPEAHFFAEDHTRVLEDIARVIATALEHPQRMSCVPRLTTTASTAHITEAPHQNQARPPASRAEAPTRDLQLSPTAEPADESPIIGPRKRLYGLPCERCGAYFPADEAKCPVCGSRSR